MLAAKSTILNVKICVFSLNILVLLPACYILMFRNKKRGQGGCLCYYIIVLQGLEQTAGGYKRDEARNYSCLCYYIIVLQGLEQTTGGYRREAWNYIVVYVII